MSTSPQSTKPATVEPAVEPNFWATYETIASEYDDKWLLRTNNDMGIILTFAGLVSAVNSTFLIGLRPSPADTTNTLMAEMINIMVNGPDAANSHPTPPSNSSSITLAQAFSYSSLVYSMLTAAAVLKSKQWLSPSEVIQRRRSLEDYGMERALNQLETRKFQEVLKLSYSYLETSLLLFALSLFVYLWEETTTFGLTMLAIVSPILLFFSVWQISLLIDEPTATLLAPFRIFLAPFRIFLAPLLLSNKDATIKLSAIRWLLGTSAKPDVAEAVAAMVPFIQWPPNYDASAIYTHLRDAFTIYRYNRELFVKCGKAMAHLCLQPVAIDPALLQREWDVSGDMRLFIRDAFMAGRSAWEKLRTAKGHDNRLKLKADVRTALRTMVVHGPRSHLSHPDDEKLIWDADLQWRYENGRIPCREEFDWLVDYLMDEIDHKDDAETQHDALLALSAMHSLGSDAKRSSYIKALIHCMDRSGPKEVRYAAIRAISDAREELSTGNSMPRGVDTELLNGFSRALLAVVRPNDVPDGRDPIPLAETRCYLRLIFAMARNDEWRKRLSTDLNFKQWFTLTKDTSIRESNFSEVDFYRIGIYLRTYPDGTGHSLVDAQEGWGALTRRAWSGLAIMPIDQDFDDCLEILPALVTETKRNLPASLPTEDLRRLFGGVDQVLQTLKEDKSLDPAILATVLSFHDQLHGMPGAKGT